MRLRSVLIGLVSLSVAVGVGVACGFPDVAFAPEPDTDAGADGGDGGGTADAEPSTDAALDTGALPDDVDPEGGLVDAGVDDATAAIDAAGCISCDCDDDGHTVLDAGFCDGGPPPRPDCDDSIPAIRPTQTFLTNDTWPDASTHDVPFDWNCDGTVTKQLPYDVTCTTSRCGEGFRENPACGELAEWVKCRPTVSAVGVILDCNVDSTDMRRQGCR